MKYYYSLKYLLIIINMFSLPVSTRRTVYNDPCSTCGEPAAWQSNQCPSCLRKNNPKSSTTAVYTAPTSPNTNVYQQQPPNIFGREYIAVPNGIFQQNYIALPRNYIAVPSNVIHVHTPNISTRYY